MASPAPAFPYDSQQFRVVFLSVDHTTVLGHMSPHTHGQSEALALHGGFGNRFVAAVEQALTYPARVVWAGEHQDPDTGRDKNLFTEALAAPEGHTTRYAPGAPLGRYLINYTKHQYVDHGDVPGDADYIHALPALPALTAEGNGLSDTDFVPWLEIGIWARDLISIADTVPDGYRELAFYDDPDPSLTRLHTVSVNDYADLVSRGLAGTVRKHSYWLPFVAPGWVDRHPDWECRHWQFDSDHHGVLRPGPLNVSRTRADGTGAGAVRP
ncbi:hypothetical protein [Nocardia mexicana]|uniref:Uncharacterized protein n=1 Tax=Nocardia mexicana TaxID=279262 RepID=A0A370GNK4_9NOCA|nr:hypothetical protein [Nocardia mexicana]RDI45315.1 hypothetical protein DFR68_11385 [Nocardia mexicana]